jgi:hypothetical protein
LQIVLAGGLEEEKEAMVHWRLERSAPGEADASGGGTGPHAA